jgi:hypothetical protein
VDSDERCWLARAERTRQTERQVGCTSTLRDRRAHGPSLTSPSSIYGGDQLGGGATLTTGKAGPLAPPFNDEGGCPVV